MKPICESDICFHLQLLWVMSTKINACSARLKTTFRRFVYVFRVSLRITCLQSVSHPEGRLQLHCSELQ